MALWRRLAAEFLGTTLLAAVVVGSGIAAQQLSPGQTGLQLFENAAATADWGAVGFDLDMTLINSRPAILASFAYQRFLPANAKPDPLSP